MLTIRRRRRVAARLCPLLIAVSICCLAGTIGLAADASAGATNVQAADGPSAAPRSSSAKSPPVEPTATAHIEGGQVGGRWREGSRLIDQLGYFKLTGDHVTFISSDGKLKFEGLENLAIERISHTIGDSPDPLEWSVNGLITEYRGSNYLLVTQAVLKTKSSRSRRAP